MERVTGRFFGSLLGLPKKQAYTIVLCVWSKATSNCERYCFDQASFDDLFRQAPVFEEYFRRILENSLVNDQKRIVQTISSSAEERYESFINLFPN